MTRPRMITAYDAQADEVITVALADVAADIRRYELLGATGDSAVITPGGSR